MRGGKNQKTLIIKVLVLLGLAAARARAADTASRTVLNDSQLGAAISYARSGGITRFTAVMPEGWAFQVLVDGNEDGKWGSVAYEEGKPTPPSTADYAYGIYSSSYFCSQYILAWNADDPTIA